MIYHLMTWKITDGQLCSTMAMMIMVGSIVSFEVAVASKKAKLVSGAKPLKISNTARKGLSNRP